MKVEELFDKIDSLRLNKETKYELKNAIEDIIDNCKELEEQKKELEEQKKQFDDEKAKLEAQIVRLKQPSEQFIATLEEAFNQHPELITNIIDNRIEEGLQVQSEYVSDVDDGHEEINLYYFGHCL